MIPTEHEPNWTGRMAAAFGCTGSFPRQQLENGVIVWDFYGHPFFTSFSIQYDPRRDVLVFYAEKISVAEDTNVTYSFLVVINQWNNGLKTCRGRAILARGMMEGFIRAGYDAIGAAIAKQYEIELSEHEKIELSQDFPREFWPKQWLEAR